MSAPAATRLVAGWPESPSMRAQREADAVTLRRALLTLRIFGQLDPYEQAEWLRGHLRRARRNGMPGGVVTLGTVLAWSAGDPCGDTASAGTAAASPDRAAHDGDTASAKTTRRGRG